MFLKFMIVVLLIGLIASLGSGFYFLMVDQGDKEKRRTFHTLGVRLTLAVALILLIFYGVASGRFKTHQTPWERPRPVAPAQE